MKPRADACLQRDHLVQTMNRGSALLTDLSNEHYKSDFPSLELASIGDHYRHHLDHVRLFLEGLSRRRVDYDQRRRDTDIATVRTRALEETQKLVESLQAMPDRLLDGTLEVLQCSAPGESRKLVESNPERELLFLNSHAVHHFAIIGIAAQLHGCEFDSTVGVAPSTLAYRDQNAPVAPCGNST